MGTLFISLLFVELLLGLSIPLSIYSRLHIWPPPGKWTWQFFCKWSAVAYLVVGYLVIGVTNIAGFGIYTYIGAVVIVAGLVLFYICIKTLSLAATSGLKEKLVTHGPYRWSRNPMYIADMTVLIGTAIIFNNVYTWIIVLIWCFLFILTPLTEEPWLKKEYGEEYVVYAKKTPRFFSFVK